MLFLISVVFLVVNFFGIDMSSCKFNFSENCKNYFFFCEQMSFYSKNKSKIQSQECFRSDMTKADRFIRMVIG